ncbi:MAG: hypothetical protein GX595_17320, partial [Lentisphaerae bacterium]|nr:hypothetical protein [Lentisphaerota bacterium]
DTFYRLPAGAPLNASVQLGNTSSAPKEVMVVLHDQDWNSDPVMCWFALPPGAPLATYTVRGRTAAAWEHAMVAVWDKTGDGLAGIRLDNVDVQYQPGLSVTGVECVVPEAPATLNLARNGDFAAGEAAWNAYDMAGHTVSGGVLTFWDDDTDNGIWQDTFYRLPAGAPLNASVQLGNTSSAPKEVMVVLHDQDWNSDPVMCWFALPANAPLATYTVRGRTDAAWEHAMVAVWDKTGNGLEGIRLDNVDVQYQPGLSVTGVECVVPEAPTNFNLIRNGDFTGGKNQWNFYDMAGHSVSGGVLTFWDDDTDNSVWQDTFYRLPAGAPLNASVQLGNTSSAPKEVVLVLHTPDWSDALLCSFTLPGNAPLATYTLQGPTARAWDHATLDVWDKTGNGLEGIRLDNVTVQYQPSLSLTGVDCGAGALQISALADETLPVTPTPVVAVAYLESDDPAVRRDGAWTLQPSDAASGGAYLYSSGAAGDSLSLGFEGTWLEVVYVQHPAFGRFAVEVDGVAQQTVDGAAPESVFGIRTRVEGLGEGTHVARLVALDGAIALDALAVQRLADLPPQATPSLEPTAAATSHLTLEPTLVATAPLLLTDTPTVPPAATAAPLPLGEGLELVEAEDARVTQTGAWTAHPTDAASGGVYLYSSGMPDESLTLAVSGGQLEIVYLQHPALGRFAVEGDGQLLFEVDAYAADTVFGARAYLTLPPGAHTLRVVALEGTIALDAFAVEPTAQLPSPTPQEQATPTPGVETPVLPDATPTLDVQDTPTPTGEAPTNVPAIPTATLMPTATPTATPLPLPLPFVDPLDSPTGWLPDGAWQFVPGTGLHGSSAWWAGSTQPTMNSTFTLTTPLDLRLALQPRLSFWQRGSLPAGDLASVELSLDGGLSWLALDLQPALPAEWTERALDLTAFRGAVVLLRFRLQTTTPLAGSSSVADGWWLDQLIVEDLPLPTSTPWPTSTPIPTAIPWPTETPTTTPLPATVPALPSATALPTATELLPPDVIPAPTQEPPAAPLDPTPTDLPLE